MISTIPTASLRADNTRDAGGPERGMNLQTKVHLAAIAQREDDADLRGTDMKFAAINASIASQKTLMSFKTQCYSFASTKEEKVGFMKEANEYAKKKSDSDVELTNLAGMKRKKTEIVAQVLEHVSVSFGIK